jgi:hypothetical protein
MATNSPWRAFGIVGLRIGARARKAVCRRLWASGRTDSVPAVGKGRSSG